MEDTGRTRENRVHPYSKANVFSKIFFLWVIPLFIKGYRKDLTEDDIFPCLGQHDAADLGDKLEREWKKELLENSKNPSLWRALYRVFRRELFALAIVCLFVEYLRFAQPIILSQLLTYYEPESTMTKNEAYLLSLLLAASPALLVIFQHNFMYYQWTMGMKIKVATTALVYRKALKLSQSSLTETNVGQMVNLISNDVSKFEKAAQQMHSLWLGPVELLVILLLIHFNIGIYFNIGISGLTGIFFLIALIPLQMWLGKKTSRYRFNTALKTDERIRLINEIVSGIQVIKMFTWEKLFANLVEISRRKEMQQIKKTSIIRAMVYSFNVFVPKIAIYLCIICFVLIGNTLNARYVYGITSFYTILKDMVTRRFPEGVMGMAEAIISVRRIKIFLLKEEIDLSFIDKQVNRPVGINKDAIALNNVYVKWNQKLEEWTLKNVSMEIPSRCLAVVIGPVGSGKSTLMHTILKELPTLQGSVNINGIISYASQEPWLFMGSVRQNIIFGQSFDTQRYNQVVRVCALKKDFILFPYGDLTAVGDRGLSLSGGQRARINLARAIYKLADIYLLDDPLSAVDTYVGRQIFDKCIRNFLKDKCVILVTHQLQYLRSGEKIFLMDNGLIDFSGNYVDIGRSKTNFAKLLVELDKSEEKSEKSTLEKTEKHIQENDIKNVSDGKKESKKNDEGKAVGNVTLSVYKIYLQFGAYWYKGLWMVILFFLTQTLASIIDYYISWWVNMEAIGKTQTNATEENYGGLTAVQNRLMTSMTEDLNIAFYTMLIIILIVVTLSRSVYYFRFALNASTNLHNSMLYKIVFGTMKFFNTNPAGRILNRFSYDMNQVDEMLPVTLMETLQTMLPSLATIIIVLVVNPWMVFPTAILLIIFYFWRSTYLSTSRDVKRMGNITRSPIYSHLTASLHGLTTIRAFDAEKVLSMEFDKHQNRNSSALVTFTAAVRLFGIGLDSGCVVYIFFVIMSFLFFKTNTPGAFVGLSITQSITLTGVLQMGIRLLSELENQMTCVERIAEYIDVVPETDTGKKIPPRGWPSQGKIVFKDLTMRYGPDEPPVLKRMNFTINPKEKIGIVGRTGAGKSSIIIALFRLALNEGLITIDDIDIETISLEHLRSVISIIPQEPVLFSGTLRKNLDPFDEYDDEIIWSALEQLELKDIIRDLPKGLISHVSEGGSNFSVGQRQLMCLARAIIRKHRIIIMDEATASIDPQTDVLIQKTIRVKFAECTVLSIAHRLHTIIDLDRVLVMDAGAVAEFDIPHRLLQNKDGMFFGMVEQTGRAMAGKLNSIAEKVYRQVSMK